MRLHAIAVLTIFASLPIAAAQEARKLISPQEAKKKVGETVTVKMQVKSAALREEIAFLNSEEDFKSVENFTIFISKDAMPKFKTSKIEDPAAHFKGKTIEVTGKVILYRERPEIAVSGPDEIKVVEAEKK
jgi:DNA/RNA endonuclease YhcR with UshA esterase domain